MRIAIFQDLHDRRLMSEEKCIESLTFSLLITKSHHFQKSDNIWALQSLFRIYTVSSEASFSWVDTSTLMVINWKLTFKCRSKKFFLNSQMQEQLGKSVVKSKWLPSQDGTELYRFFLAKSHGWTKQDYFLKVMFWQYSQS